MIRLYLNNSARSSTKGCVRHIYYWATIRCCCRKVRTLFVWRLRRKASKSTTLLLSIPVPTGDRFLTLPAMSLFASRQTLVLQLPENGPNAAMNEQLATLSELLHDDLLLIVRGNKLTKAQENAAGIPRWQTVAFRSVVRRRSRRSFPLGGRQSESTEFATG